MSRYAISASVILLLAAGSVCPASLRGDGHCDRVCMSPAADFDAVPGAQSDCAGDCPQACDRSMRGDGACDAECDSWQCAWDSLDCQPCSLCSVLTLSDGVCNQECNVPACNYDGGDCVTESLPFEVYASATGGGAGSGAMNDPYVGLTSALQQLWLPHNAVYLLDLEYLWAGGDWFASRALQTTVLLPWACKGRTNCPDLATLQLTNAHITVNITHKVTIQSVRIRGYFPLVPGCALCVYCPHLAYSDSLKTWVDDRGSPVVLSTVAPQSMCDSFQDDVVFYVAESGVFIVENSKFEGIRHQPLALIESQCGHVQITNTEFKDCMSRPLGIEGGLVHMKSLPQYSPYFCGSLELFNSSVQLLNNGYESKPDSLFSGFLYVESAKSVTIRKVNFEGNFLAIGEEVGQRAALIALKRFREVRISDVRVLSNVMKGAYAVSASTDVTLPVIAEGGVSVEHSVLGLAVDGLNFTQNAGGLLHINMKSDPQNIQLKNITVCNNAVLGTDSLIFISQAVVNWQDTVDSTQTVTDASGTLQSLLFPKRLFSLSGAEFISNSSPRLLSLELVGLAVLSQVTAAWNQVDQAVMNAVFSAYKSYAGVYFSDTTALEKSTVSCLGVMWVDSGIVVTVEGLVAEGNKCSGESSGLEVAGTNCSLSITDSRFQENEGEGALRVETGNSVTAQNLSFTGNRNLLSKVSPCFHIESSVPNAVSISDSEFRSNIGLIGTAVLALNIGSLSIDRVQVVGNSARGSSAGVLFSPPPAQESRLTVTDSLLSQNSAKVNGPLTISDIGGLLLGTTDFAVHISVLNTVFEDNYSDFDGAGLVVDSYIVLSQNSVVHSCEFLRNRAHMASGCKLSFTLGVLTITQSRFEGNVGEAEEGSAITASPGSPVEGVDCLLQIQDTVFRGNFGVAIAVHSQEGSKIICLRNIYEENHEAVVIMNGGLFNDTDSLYSRNKGSGFGVGFFHEDAQVYWENVTAVGNECEGTAGVLFFTEGSVLHASNCLFAHNSAGTEAGVIYLEGGGQCISSYCSFLSNTAVGIGSVFYSLLGSLTLLHSELRENYSHEYGSVVFVQSQVVVVDSHFRNNTSGRRSPGFSLSTSSLYIEESTFSWQTGTRGSFIFASDQCDVNISNSSFEHGEATLQGGAIYITQDSVLTLSHSLITACTAKSGGGVLISGGGSAVITNSSFQWTSGGSIGALQSDAIVHQSVFSDYRDGALYFYGVPQFSIIESQFRSGKSSFGGAVHCLTCSIGEIRNSRFEGLTGVMGGAVFIDSDGSSQTRDQLSISDCWFQSCSGGAGGAVYVDSVDLSFAGNALVNNTAEISTTDVNYTGEGGGLLLACTSYQYCNVSMSNNSFIGNAAAKEGGGVLWKGVFPSSSSGNRFANNSSPYGADRASWPVLLGPMSANHSFPGFPEVSETMPIAYVLENYVSGSTYSENLLFGLFDHSSALVTSDNSSVVEIGTSGSETATVAGNLKAIAHAGKFALSGFSLTAAPGTSHVYTVTVNSIDAALKERTKDSAEYISQVGIVANFRLCVAGESVQYSACLMCPKETFSLDPQTPCQTCPSNGICYGGAALVPKAGYWRPNLHKPLILRCLEESACTGSPAPPDESLMGQCSQGYTGNLCQSCADGYSRSGRNACARCPGLAKNVAVTATLAFISGVLLVLVISISIRGAVRLGSTFSVYLKIFLNYLQMVVVAASLDMDWPNFVKRFLAGQEQASNISDQLFSVDCFFEGSQSPTELLLTKSVMMSALPAALLLLSVLCWGVARMLFALEHFSEKVIATLVMILFLLLPNIAKSMLSPFACMELDTGELWLLSDLSLRCWSAYHYRLIYTVLVPSLGVWVLGLPLTALAVLFKCRRVLFEVRIRRLFSFLYKGYKPAQYYWEFVVMYRKIMMVLSAVFLANVSVRMQALSIFAVLLVSLLVQMQIAPFLESILNALEVKSILVSATTIFLGLYYESASLGTLYIDFSLSVLLFIALLAVNLYFLISWLRAVSPVFLTILKQRLGCLFRTRRYQVTDMSPATAAKHREQSQVDLFGSTNLRDAGTNSVSKDYSISSEQPHPPNTSVLPAEREYTNPNELPVIYSLADEA